MQTRYQRHAARTRFLHQQVDCGPRKHGIECRYRLIGQQKRRLLIENAGDAHTLQLPSRELGAAHEEPIGQSHTVEHGTRAGDVEGIQQRSQ